MALFSDWSDKAGGSATRGRLRTDFWLGVVYRLQQHCDENGNCSSCGRPGPPNTWPQDKATFIIKSSSAEQQTTIDASKDWNRFQKD
jgi:hypothetical protein